MKAWGMDCRRSSALEVHFLTSDVIFREEGVTSEVLGVSKVDSDSPADSVADKMWTIYAVIDPEDHRVFFVGKVCGARAHRTGAHAEVDERIRQIRVSGAKPVFLIMEERADDLAAEQAQSFWVKALKKRGHKLLNSSPRAQTDEERQASRRERALERGLPGNTGQRWTEDLDTELIRLYKDVGIGGREIAQAFQRTHGAIAARLTALGILSDRSEMRL